MIGDPMGLMGKMVVVEASGITYTGRLVEIGEAEIHIEAESGWIVVPSDNISSIREAD